MKHHSLKHAATVAILASVLSIFGNARAHEGHDESAKPTSAEQEKTQIPATAEAIWRAIDQKSAELAKVIQAGSLDDVHHIAFAIRDLVAALPEHSKTLTTEQEAKVQGSVKFVATLAERLDASGDKGDKAGVQDNYDKLKKVLEGLRANYPVKGG